MTRLRQEISVSHGLVPPGRSPLALSLKPCFKGTWGMVRHTDTVNCHEDGSFYTHRSLEIVEV